MIKTYSALFLLVLVLLLVFSFSTNNLAEKKGNYKGWKQLHIKAEPLDLPLPVNGLFVKCANTVASNKLKAYNSIVSFKSEKDGSEYYKIGYDDYVEITSYPLFLTVGKEDRPRKISVFKNYSDDIQWASHWGFKVQLDDCELYIVDSNANGKIGDKGDSICGPDSASPKPFCNEIWSYNTGYEMALEGGPDEYDIFLKELPFPRDGEDEDINSGWAMFNAWRQRGGTASLKWEDKNAKWCEIHSQYCCKLGSLTHPEDENNPNYTAEGHYAGTHSNIGTSSSLREGIVLLYRTAYHAANQITPKLERSGFGRFETYFSVDVLSFNEGTAPEPLQWVWPAPGMFNVDCEFNLGGENPMPLYGRQSDSSVPLGQVIMAGITCTEPYSIRVFDSERNEVKGELTHPKRSACFEDNAGCVVLAPIEFLKKDMIYTCIVECGKSRAGAKYKWYFKTK